MNILVCTVGGSGVPIVNAVRQNAADFVYFIASTGLGDASTDRTVERETSLPPQKNTCPSCNHTFQTVRRAPPIAREAGLSADAYRILGVTDPDDLAQVDAVCLEIDRDIERRFTGQDHEVIANYTGGTKTMSLGLGAYALRTGGRWQLQVQTAPPRRDLIKVAAGDMALPQDVAGMLARDALDQADRLLRRHDYEGAAEVLQFLVSRTTLRPAVRGPLIARLRHCRMMAAWDRLDYRTAREECELDPDLTEAHRKHLRRLMRTVELFESGEPWGPRDVSGVELVEDVVHNAQRCAGRGRYDDAAARLYRATELLAQLRLLRVHGVRTGEVDVQAPGVPEASRAWLERGRDPRSGKVRIGLFAAYRLLHEMGDPLGAHFDASSDKLKGFVDLRNSSVFAHGLTPIGPAAYNRAGPDWIAWLREAVDAVGGS